MQEVVFYKLKNTYLISSHRHLFQIFESLLKGGCLFIKIFFSIFVIEFITPIKVCNTVLQPKIGCFVRWIWAEFCYQNRLIFFLKHFFKYIVSFHGKPLVRVCLYLFGIVDRSKASKSKVINTISVIWSMALSASIFIIDEFVSKIDVSCCVCSSAEVSMGRIP